MKIKSSFQGRKGNLVESKVEVSVIPLIDVILVLLIIFMATAPELISGIAVDLPNVQSAAVTSNDEPLVVSIDSNGKYYLHEIEMDAGAMQAKLQAVLKEKVGSKIFVRGDGNVSYNKVIELFMLLRNSGFQNVTLVTQSDGGANEKK